jgi:hypothetical protein
MRKLFDISTTGLSIEELEPLVPEEGSDILDVAVDSSDDEIASENSQMQATLTEIETANNVVEAIDGMIAQDKAAIEAGEPSDTYVKMSVENFRTVLSVVGFNVSVLQVSSESFTTMTALQVLNLSIEEKEEVKKGILGKIGEKVKEVGERFMNTMRLIRIANMNTLNVIKEVRSRIAASSKTPSKPINNPTKKTTNRLLFSFAYLNLKKLDDENYMKLCNGIFDFMFQVDNIKTTRENLQKLVTGNYIDVKLARPAAKTDLDKDILEALDEKLTKKGIGEDKLIGYFTTQYWDVAYFSNKYIAQPTGICLYSKNQKPTFFKGATGYLEFNATHSFDALKELDDVELPSIETLTKIVNRVEKAVHEFDTILGEINGIQRSVNAIGDISPIIYLNILIQHLSSARMYYTKGLLHMVNTMLKHYKA